MCGIVGFISKSKKQFYAKHLDLFEEMLVCDSVRGNDSTGAFTVLANNQVKAVKVATNPHYLFETEHWSKFRETAVRSGHVLVGHNRKATFGKVSRENAHPFAEKNIILVHNGTVNDHKQMADVEVDSHAICHQIGEKGYMETIKNLKGAFVLVWYDITSRTMHLSRNNERPLVYVEAKDYFAFASEGYMLQWILKRNGFEFDKILGLPPDVVISVSWNPFVVKREDVEKPKVVSLYHPHWSDNDDDDDKAAATKPDMSKTWEYYNDCYKKDMPVIFTPDNYIEPVGNQIGFRMTGMAYIPGKPILHRAVAILDKDFDEADVMDMATEDDLVANIRNIVLTADDQILVYLTNVRTEVHLDLWNNVTMLETEWLYFVEHFKCSKCNSQLAATDNQLTSITKEPSGYRVICADCVCANADEMPEEHRNRLIEHGGRIIDAVK